MFDDFDTQLQAEDVWFDINYDAYFDEEYLDPYEYEDYLRSCYS